MLGIQKKKKVNVRPPRDHVGSLTDKIRANSSRSTFFFCSRHALFLLAKVVIPLKKTYVFRVAFFILSHNWNDGQVGASENTAGKETPDNGCSLLCRYVPVSNVYSI